MTLKGHYALCYANRAVLWLNVVAGDGTLGYGNKAFIGIHNHVSICSGLATILNAKLLHAAITRVR